MFNKILVPLDGSELAERALEPALTLTQYEGGELLLLRVPVYKQIMVPGAAGYGLLLPDQSLDRSQAEAEEYLDRVRQDHPIPNVTIRAQVAVGDVAGVIVDLAADEDTDIIVMTTHGYSGFTRWMLGSMTERVLRSAPCPVLAIRHAGPLRHVVIALDGSELAEQALVPGLELARIMNSRVTFLQVNHEAPVSLLEAGMLDMASTGLGKQIERDVNLSPKSYLHHLAERYVAPDQEVETVVVSGQPAQGILDFVESQQVDLVVMATHGRTGMRRWVYGSVTEKVLRHADCALLVVRPPAEKPVQTN